MPNYLFKCGECGYSETFTRPMSSDPKERVMCPKCNNYMTRRISKSNFVMSEGQTLGKWFKNKTGKELLGDK